MKILPIVCGLALALTSSLSFSESPEPEKRPFGQKILWSESQGRFSNNAVLDAPEKHCPGDIMVDLANVTLPNVKGTWKVNSWAEMASNRKAFIIRFESNHVYSASESYPSLSTVLNPSAEVIFTCLEPDKLSIGPDENGDPIFYTHDSKMLDVLKKARVNYVFQEAVGS